MGARSAERRAAAAAALQSKGVAMRGQPDCQGAAGHAWGVWREGQGTGLTEQGLGRPPRAQGRGLAALPAANASCPCQQHM